MEVIRVYPDSAALATRLHQSLVDGIVKMLRNSRPPEPGIRIYTYDTGEGDASSDDRWTDGHTEDDYVFRVETGCTFLMYDIAKDTSKKLFATSVRKMIEPENHDVSYISVLFESKQLILRVVVKAIPNPKEPEYEIFDCSDVQIYRRTADVYMDADDESVDPDLMEIKQLMTDIMRKSASEMSCHKVASRKSGG